MNKKYTYRQAQREISRANPVMFIMEYAFMAIAGIFSALLTPALQNLFEKAGLYIKNDTDITNIIMAVIIIMAVNIISEIADGIGNYYGEIYFDYAHYFFMDKVNCKVAKIAPEEFEKSETLDKINKAYYNAMWIRQSVNCIMDIILFYVPYVIITAIYLGRQNIILLVIFPLIIIPGIASWKYKMDNYRDYEENIEKSLRRKLYFRDCIVSRENMHDTRVLHAFDFFFRKYENELNICNKEKYRVDKSNIKCNSISGIINLTAYFIIVAILVLLTIKGKISVAAFTAIIATLKTMTDLFTQMLCERAQEFAKDYEKAKKFVEFMNMPEISESGRKTGTIKSIEFRNVSYTYPDGTKALDNVSFKINAGEKIAVAGQNGSGKTTLAKLIAGIYTDNTGEILIDGVAMQDIKRTEYQEHLACMFQQVNHYNMTIAENIGLGVCNCEAENIIENNNSMKLFGMSADTLLGPQIGGMELSGGQWQYLAMQRIKYRIANMKQVDVAIFDEPTSAMDPLRENDILHDMNDMSENLISLFITHRLGSVRFCDKVLVLDNGVLRGYASHDELVKSCPEYMELWNSQSL